MAAYFALVIPIAVATPLYVKDLSTRTRALFLAGALTSVVALLLTHNRAGLFGAIISIALTSLYMARSPAKLLRLLLLGAAAAAIVAWTVSTYFHEQWLVYEGLLKLTDVAPDAAFETAESDRIRIILFQYAIRSLATNPVGNGYTLLTGLAGHPDADAHNIITQLIWAAGLFGIGWLVYFATALAGALRVTLATRNLSDPIARYAVVMASGLLGWFLCGMSHQILGTGMAWLLLGILIKVCYAAPRVSHVGAVDSRP
jgi:hypothetical protein